LINRVLFSCTASANLEAKSAETVMPDNADMVVCGQELSARYLWITHYVVSSAKYHVRPIPGLQGMSAIL
jgi:phospholipase/lecithinase/hemolysin